MSSYQVMRSAWPMALLAACSAGDRAPRQQAQSMARTASEAPSAPHAPAREGADATNSAAEWEEVRLENESPLCVFADHAALDAVNFARDAKRQKLRAGSTVVFGVFTPGCRSEACDGPPTLHCTVERGAPNTLVVESRLVYSHKRGTTCTSDCQPVVAGCESEALTPGTYAVRYGARSFALRIPTTLQSPCFPLD